jgi:hypothetical protein
VIGAEAKRRGDWRERQEVKIEERSFVANGAPLDDGQRRMVRGERATAEPGKAAKSGRAALEILRPHNNVRWRAFGAVGFDGSGACRKRRLAAALRSEEAAMMIAKRKAAGLRPTLQRRMRLDGTACGEVRAIEERSFVAKGAPQDDGQGRMVRGEQAAAEPGQAAKGPDATATAEAEQVVPRGEIDEGPRADGATGNEPRQSRIRRLLGEEFGLGGGDARSGRGAASGADYA